MKKYILPIIILGIILSFASAVYTPPSPTNITLILTPPYSAPSYTNITLTLIGGDATPEVQNLNILPATPFTTDDIECSFINADIDSEKTNVTIRWYNNSKPALTKTLNNNYGNGTTIKSNLTAGNTTRSESWLCEVWLYDGQLNSTLVNSSTLTIQNTLPAIISITIAPNPAYNNNTLNCSAVYNDADLDKSNITFSWYNGSTLYWQITQFNKPNGTVVDEPLTWFNKTGLVGYWKFSEGNGTVTRDISGNENNGTLNNLNWNANSGWVDGKYGKALQFDGSNDYVNVADSDSLDLGSGKNITIAGWINVKSSKQQRIVAKYLTNEGGYSFLVRSDDALRIVTNNGSGGSGSYQAISTNTITQNTWNHVVGIITVGEKLRIYLNGNEVSYSTQDTYISEDLSTSNPFIIGTREDLLTDYFNGSIDDLMVFNRSLSSGEISEIYNNSPHARGETWNCTINATDSGGAAGLPNSTTRTISNAIPDVPEIGGPENATRTIGNSQTLRCANSSDTDGDTINYVFYGGTTTNPTTMLQNLTSTTYAWATTDGQTYYWRCKAEDGAGGVSAFATQKTFTENTQPTAVNMVYPADGSMTTNRTPQFNWTASTDAEGDSITYQINVTCYPSCSADNRLPNSSTNENWITITSRLKNFWDDNYYYNWTVRAWDGYEFSTWNSVPYTLKLSSLVSLSMINSSVNFSVLSMGDTANTTTNNPVPLSIRNDGNSFVSVNMSNETSLLWTSQPTASEYFRYRIDNVTGEENSFNWTLSTTAWTNVPTSNNTVINYLNYTDATDSAEIEILVTVPPQETAGTKSSRLVFTGFYVREI